MSRAASRERKDERLDRSEQLEASGLRDHRDDRDPDLASMAALMTPDRPTGPATPSGRAYAEKWPENTIGRAAANLFTTAIEAEQKARILAALPEALRIVDEDEMDPSIDTYEVYAAALAAAIERQLSREPGEEG